MMKSLTVTGVVQIKTNELEPTEPTAHRFVRLVEKDLKLAMTKGTISAMSARGNRLTFTFASMSRRFMAYPATRYVMPDQYPIHLAEFTRWAATASSGQIAIEQKAGLWAVTYQLNFSQLFRWALFIFTATALVGLTVLSWERRIGILALGLGLSAFIIFGLYFGGGVLTTILSLRSYLKKRMRQAMSQARSREK